VWQRRLVKVQGIMPRGQWKAVLPKMSMRCRVVLFPRMSTESEPEKMGAPMGAVDEAFIENDSVWLLPLEDSSIVRQLVGSAKDATQSLMEHTWQIPL
jgi:hypothetical protein